MVRLVVPALLIFLCGIGVGLSLFPHVMPQASNVQPAETAETVLPEVTYQHDDLAVYIPEVPQEAPLTANDQESYVLQLFSPTSSQVNEMQTESEQMKLLEQTMMISFLLSNCGLMKKAEYQETYIAMVKYLTNSGVDQPQRVAQEAAKRAKASYQMVYRHVSCNDPSLYQTAASLAEWRNSVSAQVKN